MLPVSAMDIRRVQSVWKKISSGGEIKVKISEDIDQLANDQMVIAVGADKHISYEYQPLAEMMKNYFSIVEEANSQLIELLNKQTIQSGQWCSIFAFSLICPNLKEVERLREQQKHKIESLVDNANSYSKIGHKSTDDIFSDDAIPNSRKLEAIICSVMDGFIDLDTVKSYLQATSFPTELDYKKLLCTYDYKKHHDMTSI
jgi:hypothetical protein